jgi:hypothetical protein
MLPTSVRPRRPCQLQTGETSLRLSIGGCDHLASGICHVRDSPVVIIVPPGVIFVCVDKTRWIARSIVVALSHFAVGTEVRELELRLARNENFHQPFQ